MVIKEIHKHIEEMSERDLSTWKTLVAQPSISTQGNGVRQCAELLKGIMEDAGIKVTIYETPSQPIIYGEVVSDNPDAFTVLFYGHYDVQPPDPIEKWTTPPFEPTIRDGRLYGRGAADNKGQHLAHILAVRSYLKNEGTLPINVKFVLEGEEEIGSPYLGEFVKENRELLSTDMVITSDGPIHDSGAPLILFGVRGVMNLELILETANTDNHSGNKGGVIRNAAWDMIDLLSTMKDENGKATIEGFYDDVLPPSDYDLELIEKLPYDPESLAKVFGVEKITLEKEDYYRKLIFKPTLTVNGLVSGYIEEGTKTIIPGKAVAKLEARLVLDQDPEDIFKKIENHVKKHNPKVKVVKGDADMLPSRTPADLPASKTIAKAVSKGFGAEPIIMPSMGGSLPDYVWTKILGVPSVMVPYANADEANHAPNENMKLECFYKGIHTSAEIIYELGEM